MPIRVVGYITIYINFTTSRWELACVAWRFWLGALSNKGEREQRNHEEIGAEAT